VDVADTAQRAEPEGPSADDRKRAVLAGFAAGRSGEGLDTCPFGGDEPNSLRYAWLTGWNEAVNGATAGQ
jgi:ribosome modulation factor